TPESCRSSRRAIRSAWFNWRSWPPRYASRSRTLQQAEFPPPLIRILRQSPHKTAFLILSVAKFNSLGPSDRGISRALPVTPGRRSPMERSLAELEVIVRNRICGVCTSRAVSGDCGLEQPSSCALFRLFPQVALAIQSVQSDDIQLYIDAIRRNVCSVC